MDSYTLTFVLGAAAGAAIAGAGLFIGYRLGRQAAITHDGINQARAVRDRIVAGILADGAVTQNVLADGAVTENRIAAGAVKPN